MQKNPQGPWTLILFSLVVAILALLLWQARQQMPQPRVIRKLPPRIQATTDTAKRPTESAPVTPPARVLSGHPLLPGDAAAMDPALTSLLTTCEIELRHDPGPLVRRAGSQFLSLQAPMLARIDAPDDQPEWLSITPTALETITLDSPRTEFEPPAAMIRGLLCAAILASESGEPDAALARIQAAFSLAQAIAVDGGKGPRLNGYQLSLRMMRLTLSCLRQVAARYPDPGRLTTSVWTLFETLASHEVSLADVARFQEKFQSLLLINGPDPDLPGLPAMLKEACNFPFIRRNLDSMRQQARPLLKERYALLIQLLEDDTAEQPGKIQAFIRENEENWTRSLIRRKNQPAEYFAWSVVLAFMPDFLNLLKDRDSWRMERDATLGYLELLGHLRRGGPLPADLDALPGGTDLPHDICSPEGEPYRITRQGSRLKLYGNGYNLKDDQGTPGLDFVIDLPLATMPAEE